MTSRGLPDRSKLATTPLFLHLLALCCFSSLHESLPDIFHVLICKSMYCRSPACPVSSRRAGMSLCILSGVLRT